MFEYLIYKSSITINFEFVVIHAHANTIDFPRILTFL